MRRGTVRRPGKKGAGGTLKKQMIVMAAMLAILAFEAVYLAYQSSNRLASSVSDVWQGMLETQSEHVRNSLFMKNPYLTPDTLYLAKLKAAFYDDPDMVVETSREAGCDPGHVSLAISNLCSNIKMGITYSNSLRSCYWMLEDPDAPYVLINGNPTIKAEVTDAEWMDVCREMEQDVRVEWRTIPLSYLNNTSVLTVYRRIRSESFLPGETITGYWVLNYDLSNMLSAFTAQMSGAGFVCLYDTRREDGLTAGNFELPQQEETEIVEKVLQAWETDSPTGVVRNGQNEAFYYRAEEVCPGTLSIVCIQDRQLSQALDGVVRSITAALLVSCVAVAGINLYSILRYRKYSRGLRKMFDALRSRQGEQRAAEDPQESTGSEILLQRILNNDVDLEELQGGVQAGIEGRAGRPVWPCADQLSFSPQHAGFHLLVQRKPDGCGQQRIGHDRRPVRDPEICAGFLGLVHLPSRGGGMHAALYRDPANAQEHRIQCGMGHTGRAVQRARMQADFAAGDRKLRAARLSDHKGACVPHTDRGPENRGGLPVHQRGGQRLWHQPQTHPSDEP